MEKDYKELYEETIIRILKNYGYVIDCIENPTEEMQLLAVKQRGYAIQFIKNPTEEVQLEAVKQEYKAIDYIANPTEKVKALVRKIAEQNDYKKKYEELLEQLKKYTNK